MQEWLNVLFYSSMSVVAYIMGYNMGAKSKDDKK
jgi:hypothetical protein